MLINSNKKFSTTVFLLFSLIIITQFLLPINSFSQSHTILWQEDWEGDWINNWYVDGGTWEVGAPTSGPDSAYIGQKCAATVLDGNYSESVNSRLIRRTSFKVPSASENPRLRFWHWYSFSSFDYGEIQIKTGSIWKTISTQYTSTGSDVWTYPLIDLSAYADSTVQIAFYFYSRQSGSYASVSKGWYIDDVEIITGPISFDIINNPESFEFGIGDWYVDEGTWEVGYHIYSGQNLAATVIGGNYAESVKVV